MSTSSCICPANATCNNGVVSCPNGFVGLDCTLCLGITRIGVCYSCADNFASNGSPVFNYSTWADGTLMGACCSSYHNDLSGDGCLYGFGLFNYSW